MRGNEVLFSGAHNAKDVAKGSTDCWQTPQAFYDLLDGEFGFTLDPCASADNAKCAYFDINDDGLAQDWGDNICFVNFPYSQAMAWALKCVDAAQMHEATVVVLCAARTDTAWWQWLAAHADEVRFIKGRLAFVAPGGKGQGAPFPSCVFVLRPYAAPEDSVHARLWEVPSDVRR